MGKQDVQGWEKFQEDRRIGPQKAQKKKDRPQEMQSRARWFSANGL